MPRPASLRRALLTLLWRLAAFLAALRRARHAGRHVARQRYRSQTRGLGLRMSEPLRDRLRTSWLRLRRPRDCD